MTPPHTRHPLRWTILAVLILGLFGIAMDNTVLVIALPVLSRDLSATTSQLQWMVDAYVLVFAGLLLLSGALSDRYGRKLMLLIGLGLFGAGSALAPFVHSAGALIALRAFMGLGASFAMPPTLSIIADIFAEDERPKAIAAWSATSALGMAGGPILGGFLLEHFGWPSVFVVNVPVALVGIVAIALIVPESRAPGHIRMDPVGAILSVGVLVSLTYGIIEEPTYGWSDAHVYGTVATAAILAAVFLVWERRLAHPMIDLGLFRNARFSAACLSLTLSFFALNAALFLLTLYLQEVRALSPLDTAYRFIAIAAGIMVTAPIGATLTTRFGAKVTTSIGLALVALGMAAVATIGSHSGDVQLIAIMFMPAAGIGLAMTPATDSIMGAVPPEKFGVGSAVNDTTREIGGAMGIAILGSVFSGAYADRVATATSGLPSQAADAVRSSLAGAAAVAAQMGGATGAGILETARTAFIDAMSLTCLVGAGFGLAGVLVAAAFLPSRATPAHALEANEETIEETVTEDVRPEPSKRTASTPA